jgi:hypothetical protein
MIKFAICLEIKKCDREQATEPPFFRSAVEDKPGFSLRYLPRFAITARRAGGAASHVVPMKVMAVAGGGSCGGRFVFSGRVEGRWRRLVSPTPFVNKGLVLTLR